MPYIDSEVDPAVGDRIRQFAIERYGSVNAFARAVGMHPVQVSKYVQHLRRPGMDALERFMKVGMSIDWLLTGQSRWIREATIQQPTIDNIGSLVQRFSEWIEFLKKQQQIPQLPPNRTEFY